MEDQRFFRCHRYSANTNGHSNSHDHHNSNDHHNTNDHTHTNHHHIANIYFCAYWHNDTNPYTYPYSATNKYERTGSVRFTDRDAYSDTYSNENADTNDHYHNWTHLPTNTNPILDNLPVKLDSNLTGNLRIIF